MIFSESSDKCNTEIDCKDKSDEHNCDFMFFGEQNYAKELIPRDEGGFHLCTLECQIQDTVFP